MSVLVVVVGPQASGKSTLSSALGQRLREGGEVVAVVELDALAAMALPTLPSWEVAHRVFEAVAGLWIRSGVTCVVAEGGSSREEVDRVVRQAPAGADALVVAVTTSFAVAYERARADPTRGISKEHDFLSGVYARWPEELRRIEPDLVVDTTHDDVDSCAEVLVREVARRRSSSSS